MIEKAVVVGATGLVGRHLIQELLSDPSVKSVTALVRKPLSLNDPRLRQVVVDFSNLSSVKAEFSGSHFFCCLGTTIAAAGSQSAFQKIDLDLVVTSATLAFQGGIPNALLISSLGADSQSRVFYSRVKGMAEETVAKLRFPSLTIFRPSLLLGPRPDWRLGEWIAQKTAPLWGAVMLGVLKKYKGISARTVARAMVAAAKKPEAGVLILESDRIEALGR